MLLPGAGEICANLARQQAQKAREAVDGQAGHPNDSSGPIGPVRPEPVEVRPIADGRRACAGLLDEVVAEEAFEGFPGHASA